MVASTRVAFPDCCARCTPRPWCSSWRTTNGRGCVISAVAWDFGWGPFARRPSRFVHTQTNAAEGGDGFDAVTSALLRTYLHLTTDRREDLLELIHGVHVAVAVELGVDELAIHDHLERAGRVLRGFTLGLDAWVLRLDSILHLLVARTVTCDRATERWVDSQRYAPGRPASGLVRPGENGVPVAFSRFPGPAALGRVGDGAHLSHRST